MLPTCGSGFPVRSVSWLGGGDGCMRHFQIATCAVCNAAFVTRDSQHNGAASPHAFAPENDEKIAIPTDVPSSCLYRDIFWLRSEVEYPYKGFPRRRYITE